MIPYETPATSLSTEMKIVSRDRINKPPASEAFVDGENIQNLKVIVFGTLLIAAS
jgi:hypothetical protein